jgi:hypothetical protein
MSWWMTGVAEYRLVERTVGRVLDHRYHRLPVHPHHRQRQLYQSRSRGDPGIPFHLRTEA